MSKLVEEWRDIAGYEGLYQVSDWGNVRSLNYRHTKEICNLKQEVVKDGYKRIVLCHKVKKKYLIHRLVAEAFIPNPDNKPLVDHIIPISEGGSNELSNLRWCTYEENLSNPDTHKNRSKSLSGDNNPMYGVSGSKHPNAKEIYQFDKNNNLIKKWPCIKEASTALNINRCCIQDCCRNRSKTAGGFIWKYA